MEKVREALICCKNCKHIECREEYEGPCAICSVVGGVSDEMFDLKPELEAELKSADEALEKQKAKKVTHEATLQKCCTCPACKNVVDHFEKFGGSTVRVTYQHCHFCGQKLEY